MSDAVDPLTLQATSPTQISGHAMSQQASSTMNQAQTSDAPKQQHSPLLRLPKDVFKCVLDHLDRDDAWSLKRLCRGFADSQAVGEALYRHPIQWEDVQNIKLHEWRYRPTGQARWQRFVDSITDANRHYVLKIAMTHWCSIADFQWMEKNLPNLASLDLSAIKDFVWTPEETWTWKELAAACPKLLERLKELEVTNWADYSVHSSVEYNYSWNDYRFKQKFRMSRRRDGGSVARMIFPQCKKLETLAIRERHSGYQTWNEWEVHQRVCCLADGITQNCPPTLHKLRVYDYTPFRCLVSFSEFTWSNISNVEIDLYKWIDERKDRALSHGLPLRVTQGFLRRPEEDEFIDKAYDQCSRNHMDLGAHIIQSTGGTFEDLLQSVRTIATIYPHITVKPVTIPGVVELQPFQLVALNQNHRRLGIAPGAPPPVDVTAKPEMQDILRWLAAQWHFKPIFVWGHLMCDAFPENLEPSGFMMGKPPPRPTIQKDDVLLRIFGMAVIFRTLNIPIRVSIGHRSNPSSPHGIDGSLLFGDFKTLVGQGLDRRELILPSQASFNLSNIAHMIDELIIEYPFDVPGVINSWTRDSSLRAVEESLFEREMVGWRRFWARYARQMKNLKKLTVHIPSKIYRDWGRCKGLHELLADDRWQMLEVKTKGSTFISLEDVPLGGLVPRSTRVPFVQRVFFRTDDAPLHHLQFTNPSLTSKERDETPITEEELDFDDTKGQPHRFFAELPDDRGVKRGLEVDGTPEDSVRKRARQMLNEQMNDIQGLLSLPM
ncbi:unnamed protein product [Periconia digitata]|uniref:F-box domain-containing protein n=1 Tax=Periconia digitata TaxID=1303443 RepID=A0A9W4U5M2_9PLEO|nr:unnamed protein product [Periconia digitata]